MTDQCSDSWLTRFSARFWPQNLCRAHRVWHWGRYPLEKRSLGPRRYPGTSCPHWAKTFPVGPEGPRSSRQRRHHCLWHSRPRPGFFCWQKTVKSDLKSRLPTVPRKPVELSSEAKSSNFLKKKLHYPKETTHERLHYWSSKDSSASFHPP